jgi:DNA-binding HxlR family transcriptional regulator
MPLKRECLYTDCPVEAALDLIGGKWRTMIVALLLDNPLRFSELRRSLKGITHRVLAAQLRDLEDCGIVRREVFAEVPARVQYSLTDLGLTLRPLLGELRRWGSDYALALRNGVAASTAGAPD